MESILQKYKTNGVYHTHVSMGSIKGRYMFNREHIEEFWSNHLPNLNSGLGIAEKPQNYIPVISDIDIKIAGRLESKRIHTLDHIITTIKTYNTVLKTIVEGCTDKHLKCILLEKPLYHSGNFTKDGYHLHWPYCFLSKQDQEIHLIPRVQDILSKLETFKDIGITDSGSVVDKSACKVPWLIYGQSKGADMDPYMFSKVFNSKAKEITLEKAFGKYQIFDIQEKLIPLAGVTEENLPRILSIIPYGRDTLEVKAGLVMIGSENIEKTKRLEHDYVTTDININIEDVKILVCMLNQNRTEERLPWLQVGWCLHAIGNGSTEYLDIWKTFSARSDKYEEKVCDHQWDQTTRNDLKMGSLHYWAKTDNPEEYTKFKFENSKKYAYKSISGGDYDLAILFMKLYGSENIKITDIQKFNYYGWDKDTKLWVYSSKNQLKPLISNALRPILRNVRKELIKKLNKLSKIDEETGLTTRTGETGETDKDDKDDIIEKIAKVSSILANIRRSSSLSSIMEMLGEYLTHPDFESKIINKSPHELPIKNGKIIDLKTLEVRDRTKNDFFSFELNVEYTPDCNFETNVLRFFKDITLNSPDLIDYHRRMWGYMMTGSITDRSLHIMWGNGCNGKSSIVNIFKGIMGDYAVSLDEDTMLKKSSSGAKPEMMDLLHSRCGIMPESDKKESINSKRVKTITGDDDISARHLYGNIVKFRTQCKPIFPTNFKPDIDIDDKAILDRLKLIPFLGRFEKNKANSDYIKDLQENKLNEFFTWFCTGARDWIAGDELIPCADMNDQMDIYIKENNPVIEFLDETYDLITKEEYSKLPSVDKEQWRYKKSDMFPEYGAWRQVNDQKSMKKGEFNSLIEKRVDEVKNKQGIKCYLCRIKQIQENNNM